MKIMTNDKFLDDIHQRIAQVCVGSSSLRNQGAKGIIEIARKYFYESISLDDFIYSLSTQKEFEKFLDHHTINLLKKFPPNGKSWGAARKGLNLFFREIVYNKFISDHFKLPKSIKTFNKLIQHLEVPLDRDVATGLYKDSNKTLPKWESIKGLTDTESKPYQLKALEIANHLNTARVHLDLIYWRSDRK